MTDGIYFADAELPFHVWVRERKGDTGYKWVLREARAAESERAAESPKPQADTDGAAR